MASQQTTRRDFLLRSSAAMFSVWLSPPFRKALAAQDLETRTLQTEMQATFEFFTPEQAADIEAIAAHIIPSDETPGAREARVVVFIDRGLATAAPEWLRQLTLGGLEALQTTTRELFPEVTRYADLDSDRQAEVLTAMGPTPFLQSMVAGTVVGFLADPSHGGNYEKIGWKHIGFEGRFVYQPPFGHYDRDYQEG